ncbi:MAG: recombinase family protein [Planctomycetota bacterium]
MIARQDPPPIRVPIYCRKSVTEGLDQEFNSLDAQRQSCEAYVQSQAGAGWVALDRHYDDGGFSGSTTERPAFQALLRDVEDGLVDAIAVYKIDRLSRSLWDFAKLIDLFERRGVTFVSVTQQFSTGTSMGRLTLNMLMSFAEYELEVIGERIRDKKQAMRRLGMWTGGRPSLGYDVEDKKLVVNQDEAAQVRATFELYLDARSLSGTVAELEERGWRNKSYRTRDDRMIGGRLFSKATLQRLLTNPIYRGQIETTDGPIDGVHEAIADSRSRNSSAEHLEPLRSAFEAGSEEPDLLIELASGLVTDNQPTAALPVAQRLMDARPWDGQGYALCSRTHLALGNNARAISFGKTAAALSPTTADIWSALAKAHLANGDTDSSEQAEQQAAELAAAATTGSPGPAAVK